MAQLKLTLRLRELLRLVLCMRGALGFAFGPRFTSTQSQSKAEPTAAFFQLQWHKSRNRTGQTSRKGGLKTWLMMTLFCTSLPRSYAPYAPRPSSPSRSLLHLSLSMSLSLSLSRSRVWSRSCFRSKLRSRSRLLCSCSIKDIQNVLIKRIVRETQS